jgi:uncharacterized protein (TIGR02001 family)
MRKTVLSVAIAALSALPAVASAQSAPAAAPSPITGNAGLFSQYIFRGLTQTGGKPALQGGVDYAHESGLYAGTWLSNISWIEDAGAARNSSLEWDFYGGYKGTFGKSDFGYDVGVLQYYYPGLRTPGAITANTREIYGAVSWKWLSAKFSRSMTEKTFGVEGSKGTWYLDFTATVPVSETISLVGHYGIQKYKGSSLACGAGVPAQNDNCASYKDWKLGASYAMPQSWTIGAYLTGTRMNASQRVFYTSPAGNKLGNTALTAYLQKTF